MAVKLPDLDGFAATRQISALPKPPAVILLTIHHQMEEMLQAQEVGAFAYIEKSAGVDAVLTAIYSHSVPE